MLDRDSLDCLKPHCLALNIYVISSEVRKTLLMLPRGVAPADAITPVILLAVCAALSGKHLPQQAFYTKS